MTDLSAIASVVGSLNAAKDILGALVGARDRALADDKIEEIRGKLFEASQRALTAQQEHATALHRIAELEQHVTQLTERNREKKKYKLESVYPGAFALVRQIKDRAKEQPHWLCQHCFENGQNFVLQSSLRGRMRYWKCPGCNHEFPTNPSVSPDAPFTPRSET